MEEDYILLNKPVIERIMSSTYFNGIKNDEVLEKIVHYQNDDCWLLISKYLSKNTACIKGAMAKQNLLEKAVNNWRNNLKWCKLLFDLYSKLNVVPRKDHFQEIMSKFEDDDNSKSQDLKMLIQENYNKYYAKK